MFCDPAPILGDIVDAYPGMIEITRDEGKLEQRIRIPTSAGPVDMIVPSGGTLPKGRF